MNNIELVRAVLFALSITAATCACADVYTLADDNGAVELSNVPTDDHYTLLLKTPEEPAPIAQTTVTASINTTSSKPYADIVEVAARDNKIDGALLHAVIATESAYNPRAISNKGASGLMQLMPATAKRYGVNNRYNPSENISGGARYLSDLMHMFNNDKRLALAAYNAGENAVLRCGNKVPPYRETIGYVDKVMRLYSQNKTTIY